MTREQWAEWIVRYEPGNCKTYKKETQTKEEWDLGKLKSLPTLTLINIWRELKHGSNTDTDIKSGRKPGE